MKNPLTATMGMDPTPTTSICVMVSAQYQGGLKRLEIDRATISE